MHLISFLRIYMTTRVIILECVCVCRGGVAGVRVLWLLHFVTQKYHSTKIITNVIQYV